VSTQWDPIYSLGNTHSCWRLSRPQKHGAAGRTMLKKNSKDTIGNRTRNLPDCSALPKLMWGGGKCFPKDRKKKEIWAKHLAI